MSEKKVNEAQNWFISLQKYSKEEEGEKEYLESLVSRYVVSKTKNYSLARSIVLDIHCTGENYFNIIIGAMFVIGVRDCHSGFGWKELKKAIALIDYYRKMEIIKTLNIFSKTSTKIMQQINDLRSAFAHGHKEDSNKYQYKGKSIFGKDAIDILLFDFENNIRKEAITFVEKLDKCL